MCTTSGWRRKRSSPQGFEIGVLLIRSCSLKTQSLPESLELQNQSEHLSTHGIFETPIEPQQPQSCPFRLSKAESKINRQQAASVIVVVSIRTNCQQVADHGLSWTCQCCNVAIAHLFDMWETTLPILQSPAMDIENVQQSQTSLFWRCTRCGPCPEPNQIKAPSHSTRPSLCRIQAATLDRPIEWRDCLRANLMLCGLWELWEQVRRESWAGTEDWIAKHSSKMAPRDFMPQLDRSTATFD